MLKGAINAAGIILLLALTAVMLLLLAGQAEAIAPSFPYLLWISGGLILLLSGIFFLGCSSGMPFYPAGTPLFPEGFSVQRSAPPPLPSLEGIASLEHHLRGYFGQRWRYRLPWLLVIGQNSAIEKMAPDLTATGWQMTASGVLIGLKAGASRMETLLAVRQLRHHRPIDALVWVTEFSRSSVNETGALFQTADEVQRVLRWRSPVYVLAGCPVPTGGLAGAFPVGILSARRFSLPSFSRHLKDWMSALASSGVAQVIKQRQDDTLLQLAARLPEPLERFLVKWDADLRRRSAVSLHGMAIIPLPERNGEEQGSSFISAAWDLLAAHSARALTGQASGVTWRRIALVSLSGVLLLFGSGVAMNGYQDSRLIRDVQAMSAQVRDAPRPTLLQDVERQLEAISRRRQTFWLLHLGPAVAEPLRSQLQDSYRRLVRQYIRIPAEQQLKLRLQNGIGDKTPASAERTYEALKTYLLLADPYRVRDDDTKAFLRQRLAMLPLDIPASSLDYFVDRYADIFALSSFSDARAWQEWQLAPDTALIAAARDALNRSTSSEEALMKRYHAILDTASDDYGPLTLARLTGGYNIKGLYAGDGVIVPGHFTRRAYEERINPALEKMAHSPQEYDWVVQNGAVSGSAKVQAEQLRQRYLQEFGDAWQKALNQLRFLPADRIDKQTEQLERLTRRHDSPLIALMRTLAFQGLTESPNPKRREVNPALVPVFGSIVAMVVEDREWGHRRRATLSQWLSAADERRRQLQRYAAQYRHSGSGDFQPRVNVNTPPLSDSAVELQQRVAEQLGGGWRPMTRALFVLPLAGEDKGHARQKKEREHGG
ncbi:hypothetical protein DLP14_14735 [Salmonella enterica]|nr:hypothetical protein [Salmonella enterica]EMD7797658.1 hypothetical protein [Salmonella enterica]